MHIFIILCVYDFYNLNIIYLIKLIYIIWYMVICKFSCGNFYQCVHCFFRAFRLYIYLSFIFILIYFDCWSICFRKCVPAICGGSVLLIIKYFRFLNDDFKSFLSRVTSFSNASIAAWRRVTWTSTSDCSVF